MVSVSASVDALQSVIHWAFRFSAERALSGLLQTVGLSALTVHPHATSHTVRDTDTL
jgi:hypothetical protein